MAKQVYQGILDAFLLLLDDETFGFLLDGRDSDNRLFISEWLKKVFKERFRLIKQVALQFKRQLALRGRSRGPYSGSNWECLFIVPPKVVKQWSELGKKAEWLVDCCVKDLLIPLPCQLPQCTVELKIAIWKTMLQRDPTCTTISALDNKVAMRSCGKAARGNLPMSWWDRDEEFYRKYILEPHNIQLLCDLASMSGASAVACAKSKPPVSFMGRTFTAAHSNFCQQNVDEQIIKFMAMADDGVKQNAERLFPELLRVRTVPDAQFEQTDSSADEGKAGEVEEEEA